MIYEIVNPSDPYTIESDDFAVACVVTCILGNGAYALHDTSNMVMPVLLFGGHDEWFTKTFGKPFDDMLDGIPLDKLADVLDSVVIGTVTDRQVYRQALNLIDDSEKQQQWHNSWHDKHRSSMNDIGGYAHKLAKGLRKNSHSVEGQPAPKSE